MNLTDLTRATRAAFGDCGDCREPECQSCRAVALVEIAWQSGRRSGAQGTREKAGKECAHEAWDWKRARPDLLAYARTRLHPTAFQSPGELDAWLSDQIEEGREWASSKGATRVDWTDFTKGWLRRRIPVLNASYPDPQGGLFPTSSGAFPTSSSPQRRQEQRKQLRRDTALRLLDGGGD